MEVQLVFHFLLAPERLQLARCDKRLLAEAQQPFAWKCCPLVRLSVLNAASRLSSSLLRQAPLLHLFVNEGTLPALPSLLPSLPPTPPLHTLEIGRMPQQDRLPSNSRPPIDWYLLLRQERLQPLQRLILHSARAASRADLARIVRMPHLSTLQIPSHLCLDPLLAAPPALTAISLAGEMEMEEEKEERLSVLEQLPGLTSLRLSSPDFDDSTFTRLFQSPLLSQQLSSLSLLHLWPEGDLSLAFESLTGLRVLRLQSIYGLDRLLSQLHGCHHLQELLLVQKCSLDEDGDEDEDTNEYPSPLALQELLVANTQLNIRLVLPPLHQWISTFPLTPEQRAQAEEEKQPLYSALSALTRSDHWCSPRLQLLDKAPPDPCFLEGE